VQVLISCSDRVTIIVIHDFNFTKLRYVPKIHMEYYKLLLSQIVNFAMSVFYELYMYK